MSRPAGSGEAWGPGDIAEAALLGLVGYVSFSYYLVVGLLAGTRGSDLGSWLRTPIDDAIPYMSAFVFSYALAYVLPVLAAVAVARAGGLAAFRRAFFAYLGLLALHFAFWLVFPSSARGIMLPADEVMRGTFAGGVHFFYAIAPPWNAFPSFHVAGCWFFYRVLDRWAPRFAKGYLLWFWTMFLSTLALKLHWFLDAVSGWLVAEAYYRWVRASLEEPRVCAWPWDSLNSRLAALGASLIALGTGLGISLVRLGYLAR